MEEGRKKIDFNFSKEAARKEHNPHHKHHVLDEEVTIKLKLSPRKIVKWAVVVLFFISVFYLGKLTADCPLASSPVETVEDKPDDPGLISSFLTAFFSKAETDANTKEGNTNLTAAATGSAVAESTVSQTETTETKEESSNNSEAVSTEEASVEEEENIITNYNRVSVALKDVKVDWKGTWGRIAKLVYVIKNSEEGIVKPDHFLLMVEGYDDFEKKVPLPPGSKKLKAKVTASSTATVPNGFAYSEITAGDLSDVRVTLQLYDAAGKLMTTVTKGFDLSG